MHVFDRTKKFKRLFLQQNRLRWYGRMLRKDNDWVKKSMEYIGQEVDERGPGERLWKWTVKRMSGTGRMLWIVLDGGS